MDTMAGDCSVGTGDRATVRDCGAALAGSLAAVRGRAGATTAIMKA